MNIRKSNLNNQQALSFSGHKKVQDKAGYEIQKFYYLYDSNKYNCQVELYNIEKDRNGNLYIPNISDRNKKPDVIVDMNDGKADIDLYNYRNINSNLGFAYRFKLTEKANPNKVSYGFDNGLYTEVNNNKINLVLNNRAIINKNGPMQLIMPDEYYPGVKGQDGKPTVDTALRGQALASVRTHANKLGGNFFGIIERLPQIADEGISRIVGTPFTKDSISSHLYWTENAYQVCPDLGTEESFKQLQTELFKNGINWISDAALVNEGFGGIHMAQLLRKGKKSYAKDMFRSGEKISLGILPNKNPNTRMKIINAPIAIDMNGVMRQNDKYNPAKPTFIQFYDKRLATPQQIASDSPSALTTYGNKNTDNIYDITKHDDAVYPFPIEVNPDELERNIKRITKDTNGKIDLADIDTIKSISDFSTFNVVNKSKASELEVWDGNVDIAKLNFYTNVSDEYKFLQLPAEERAEAIADFKRGALAVRDYAINSGKFWTQLTADTQLNYASSVIANAHKEEPDANGYMNLITNLVAQKKLPKMVLETVDKETVSNVINGDYNQRRLYQADIRNQINPEFTKFNSYTTSEYILRHAMDVPLETLPVSNNLLGILTSPYLAKRANTENELGVSRYDITKAGNPNLPEKYSETYTQMDNIYATQIVPIINEIISGDDRITDKKGNVTEYGKYIINEITPEITKYIFVKGLDKKADIQFKNGQIDFSHVDNENITMQSLGIKYDGRSPKDEAQVVINHLKRGISNISQDDINSIKTELHKRLTSRTLNDFKIAEMIIDKTESGLGWRIDASKDIAAIDAVRSGSESMTKAWDNVIDFWKRYNQSVLEVNPHAYTTAEITDLAELFRDEIKTKYTSDGDAERKFLQETGITSIANYNYFFSLLPEMFSQGGSFENGNENWMAKQNKNFELRNKLATGWDGNPGFLFQSPEDGVKNSYTFMGNHDKPRVLHGLSIDMELFYSNFNSEKAKNNLNKLLNEYADKDLNDEEQGKINSAENELNHIVELQKRAARVLYPNHSEEQINEDIKKSFDGISGKAIAMGERLNQAIDASNNINNNVKTKLKASVAELARGKYLGKTFDADAFGTRPFEIAIKSIFNQAKHNNGKTEITPYRDDYEAEILQNILNPAYDKFFSMYKLLVTLPGSPTDFAGDRVGASGFETKAKNYHQQNRNVIRWEWLNDERYDFIKTAYDKINSIATLRDYEIHPELSALNDGDTVALPVLDLQYNDKKEPTGTTKSEFLQSMIRYNDKGSVILTLHNLSGAANPVESTATGNTVANRLILSSEYCNDREGLRHGLSEGMIFKNQREDGLTYKIEKMNLKDHTGSEKEYYCLKCEDKNGNEQPIRITKDDYNTLILYKPLN